MAPLLWGVLVLEPGEPAPQVLRPGARLPKVWHASESLALQAWQRACSVGAAPRPAVLVNFQPHTPSRHAKVVRPLPNSLA